MFLRARSNIVKKVEPLYTFHCSPIHLFVKIGRRKFSTTSMSLNSHSSNLKEKEDKEDYSYQKEDYKRYQKNVHLSSQIASYFNKDWKLRGKEPNWAVAEPVEDRKSIFQGRAIQIGCRQEALDLIEYLKTTDKKIKKATHNITGWRVLVPVKRATESNSNDLSKREEKQNKHSKKKHQSKGKQPHQSSEIISNNDLVSHGKDLIGKGFQVDQEFNNDGEPPGGERILQLLQLMEITNVLVIVTRWYGGTKLGPDRFKHISTCAQRALEVGGFFSKKSNHHKK